MNVARSPGAITTPRHRLLSPPGLLPKLNVAGSTPVSRSVKSHGQATGPARLLEGPAKVPSE
jgi:hypothetical protein